MSFSAIEFEGAKACLENIEKPVVAKGISMLKLLYNPIKARQLMKPSKNVAVIKISSFMF